jgi:uncharacterized protein YcfJ
VNTRIRLMLGLALILPLAACVQDPGFFEVEPSQTAETGVEQSVEPIENQAPKPYDGYAIPKTITCDKQNDGALAGALIGGALGGFIGNQIPEKKEDKAAGTTIGVMLGAVFGSIIGASSDEESSKCQPMDGVLEDSLKVIKEPDTIDA